MAWITNDTNTGSTIIANFTLTLSGGVDVCRTSTPTVDTPRDDSNSVFTSAAEELNTISAQPVTSEGCEYWTRLMMWVPYDTVYAGSTTQGYWEEFCEYCDAVNIGARWFFIDDFSSVWTDSSAPNFQVKWDWST
jgi:hypothetical protein